MGGGIREGKEEGRKMGWLALVISLNTLNYLSLSVPPPGKSLIGSGEFCGFPDHGCGVECAESLTIPLGSVKNHADTPASYPSPTRPKPRTAFFKFKIYCFYYQCFTDKS